MRDRPSVALVASDGSRVAFPLPPEALARSRTALGERLELVTHLDDRLGEDAATTADTISALAAVSDDVSELHWGERRFRGSLAELTVTETAFREDLEPIAATIRLVFDLLSDEAQAVAVTVSGQPWRQVDDFGSAGPSDAVYAVRVGDNGSLHVRFGDGKRGARPPAGEIRVRARYRVGAGQAGG
jgi:hypothetical protein